MSQLAPRLSLELAPRLDEIGRMVAALEGFAGSAGLDSTIVHQVTLALDELVTNIVMHGGIAEPTARIRLDVVLENGVLRIDLSDPGRPFDPRTIEAPDTGASLEERRIGGLGVHFVRTVVDSLDYRYAEGCNHVSLHKRIGGEARP